VQPCPSLEQLQQLLEETLEAASYDAVAHHLEECPTCRDVLDALTDSTVGVWPPTGAACPQSGVTQAHSRGCYRPIRLHARGGLGEVFEVRDEQFQRPVALKVLHERDGADPDRRRRFLEEARITAQLEHPGIPPVHALAQTDDGRPGYTMRFLQGETLHEAVRKFHEADQAGRDPRAQRLALRQLLGRFLAVCNTVAYAHSKGLMHGDLKPANVMLAPFGETLVLDWGLARRFDETQEPPAGNPDLAPCESVKGATAGVASVGRIGNPSKQPDGLPIRPTDLDPGDPAPGPGVVVSQVSGTPGFMSPEQAAGRGARVGPASDIYSLGASLYFLLTGKPPFPAPRDRREWEEMAARIRRGDFPRPRVVNPRVPAALEAVCLKAMAPRPRDRYADVLDLAGDLEHWLAGEPVSARRESWWERGARWVRKHQVFTAAAAVGVLIALVSLAAGMGTLRAAYGREQQARAKADTHLESALEAVRSYLRQIHEGPQAHVPLKEGGSLPSLGGEKHVLAKQLEELTAIHKRLRAQPDDHDPRFVQLTSYVLHGLGICHALLGNRDEGEKFYLQALDLHERLLAGPGVLGAYAFDLADTACDLGRRYRSWGQPDKAERLFERVERIFHSLEAHPPVAALLAEQMAERLRLYGPPEEGLAWQEKLITSLEASHRREPANAYYATALAAAIKVYALCCVELHRPAEALRDCERLRALGNAPSPDVLLVHALCCMELNRHAEALRDWEQLRGPGGTLPAEFRICRATCLAKERAHAEAAAEAEALAATPEHSGEDLYHLAAIFAVSAGALRQDAGLPRAEAERLAEHYATQALALLTRARAAKFFQTDAAREHFAKEADFDPLRSRDDFRQFVAALADKEPAGQR
jgi:serine/threonine protein kinase